MSKQISLRKLAEGMGLSHSTLSKILNGKYNADSRHVFEKLLSSMNGLLIPAEKYEELLEMLDKARFPAKFGSAQRTATWLWDTVKTAKHNLEKREESNVS